MRTIRNHIDKRAQQEPDKIYMIAPEPKLELTYGQLKEDSARATRSPSCWETATRPIRSF